MLSGLACLQALQLLGLRVQPLSGGNVSAQLYHKLAEALPHMGNLRQVHFDDCVDFDSPRHEELVAIETCSAGGR